MRLPSLRQGLWPSSLVVFLAGASQATAGEPQPADAAAAHVRQLVDPPRKPTSDALDILRRARRPASDSTPVVATPLPNSSGPGCRVKEALTRGLLGIPVWRPARSQAGAVAVEVVRDIAYRDDADTDAYRHRLDIYRPKGMQGCPVVVLVHGGAWFFGDNCSCGLYSSVGHFLASQGIVAILPNYRLAPGVKHPGQVNDVATAVRWARDHCAGHGGDPEQLFLLGHSAGGHLVSLLATDESRLQAVGLNTADIRGVIAVSGVYRIPTRTPEFTVGGAGPAAGCLNQLFPVRGTGSTLLHAPLGVPLLFDVFEPAFGSDAKDRTHASPITFVRRGLPPFLIVSAENDLPTLAAMADEFHHALVREGCDSCLMNVNGRNHSAILFSAVTADDPVARAILAFVRRHVSQQ